MNNQLERIWKEKFVTRLKVLSHLPGETQKNDEKLQSGRDPGCRKGEDRKEL
jgi:hypothetical protein